MTPEAKELTAIALSTLSILVTVITATAKIARNMATKEDLRAAEQRLTAKIDKLTADKADKEDVNQRLLSVETFLRIPRSTKETTAQ